MAVFSAYIVQPNHLRALKDLVLQRLSMMFSVQVNFESVSFICIFKLMLYLNYILV